VEAAVEVLEPGRPLRVLLRLGDLAVRGRRLRHLRRDADDRELALAARLDRLVVAALPRLVEVRLPVADEELLLLLGRDGGPTLHGLDQVPPVLDPLRVAVEL